MATDNFDSNELFNIYLQKMGSIPLLSREDEIEVARRIAEQGNDAEIAKQTLITANLSPRLNYAVAYRGHRSLGHYQHSLSGVSQLRFSAWYENPNRRYRLRF